MAYDDPMRPELPKRPSRTVDRADAPAIRRREELEALLRAHDPDEAAKAAGRITLDDTPLLRQMALEGTLSGADPGVRSAAVSMLARLPTVENLNLLVELARRGEDPGVRAQALVGLGATGLELAAPVLCDALAARDPLEAAAGAKGLEVLARAIGPVRVRAALRSERRKSVLGEAEAALGRVERAGRGRRKAQPTRTRADEVPSSRRRT
jgi:HEAT repeat protein